MKFWRVGIAVFLLGYAALALLSLAPTAAAMGLVLVAIVAAVSGVLLLVDV